MWLLPFLLVRIPRAQVQVNLNLFFKIQDSKTNDNAKREQGHSEFYYTKTLVEIGVSLIDDWETATRQHNVLTTLAITFLVYSHLSLSLLPFLAL
jgi:hypothetical protein